MPPESAALAGRREGAELAAQGCQQLLFAFSIVKIYPDADLLALWKQRGLTVVFVTHSIHEAVFLSTRVVVMAARPGRVAGIHRIDLPRPRDVSEIRMTPAFLALHREIWAAMKEEVLKAYAAQKVA